ncbi:MAG: LysE family transporter [bacterium]|nr:LysE family transporter [bacterium]MDT8395320.1 LysE family transporter [bacterium]
MHRVVLDHTIMMPETISSGGPPGLLQFFLAAGVALAAAAPIGPISILTIQRAMSLGFWRAFGPTLGAVAGDGIFGVIAALGSGYLSAAVMGGRLWLRLIASVILIVMGLRLYTRYRMERTELKESFGPVQLGLLNFTLVLSNPLTLGFYLGAFAMLGLSSPRLFAWQSFVMVAGIVFGALVWFTLICAAAGKFRMKVGDGLLQRVRAGVGVLFVLLGLYTAVSVLLGR